MNDDKMDLLLQDLLDTRRLCSGDTAPFDDIDGGLLERLTGNVYTDSAVWAGLKRHEQQFLRCYAAACQSRDAVLVGRSAGRIGNLWVHAMNREFVELAMPNGQPTSKARWFEGHIYRSMKVPDEDIVQIGDVRFTDSARTAIDIARFHGFLEGLIAFDSILSRHNARTAEELIRHIERKMRRMRGMKGIATARLALQHATNLSESPYETWVRGVLLQNGVEAVPQMCFGQYRADLLIDGILIVEIDGYSKFDDKPHHEVLRQVKRENFLRSVGAEVERIFTDEVRDKQQRWLQRVEQARVRAAQRGPLPFTPPQYYPPGPGAHRLAGGTDA